LQTAFIPKDHFAPFLRPISKNHLLSGAIDRKSVSNLADQPHSKTPKHTGVVNCHLALSPKRKCCLSKPVTFFARTLEYLKDRLGYFQTKGMPFASRYIKLEILF